MKTQVLKNGVFTYPKGEELTAYDVMDFINKNRVLSRKYHKYMNYYVGKHAILNKPNGVNGEPVKIVDNVPKYLVDTYNGFFTGIEPKIALDDDSANNALQKWNGEASIYDKLSELSKQVDVYGRSYLFAYQDDDGNTCLAVAKPTHSFMVYDNTVSQKPICFVTYGKNSEGMLLATVYYANHVVDVINGEIYDHQFDNNNLKDGINVYNQVPAIEFYETTERQSLYGAGTLSLIDALDDTLSQKLDNINYIAECYMYLLGAKVDEKDLAKMRQNRFINAAGPDAKDLKIGFLQRPDGDNLEEHMIKHLTDAIHQNTGIPDLRDEAFGGNVSGVAIRYKLMNMENRAMNKERKFKSALKKLYKIIFSPITNVEVPEDDWSQLKFKFTRNIPANLSNEASIAASLKGIVSDETLLSVLSIVDDPQSELDRVNQEKQDQLKIALNATDSDLNGK
ncbi:phage portal protein [Lactobacillus sp.]|uniref:phage portal protein n=1 Tax=Lactobacillus sp. TaxID=1591 RepID=UPI0019C2995E|nr:phage portal protein [Lactobacillus sp.]MBD5429336.1 phage portal protein [Lactobacillus sp.]MBD5430007.1 phage portal protein [Lactobacillus sp.]